jgi:hypothetical protein
MTYNVPDIHMVDWKQVYGNLIIHGRYHPIALDVIYPYNLVNQYSCPRSNGAERRSGRKPGARVLIPLGYLHPGKGTH